MGGNLIRAETIKGGEDPKTLSIRVRFFEGIHPGKDVERKSRRVKETILSQFHPLLSPHPVFYKLEAFYVNRFTPSGLVNSQ